MCEDLTILNIFDSAFTFPDNRSLQYLFITHVVSHEAYLYVYQYAQHTSSDWIITRINLITQPTEKYTRKHTTQGYVSIVTTSNIR